MRRFLFTRVALVGAVTGLPLAWGARLGAQGSTFTVDTVADPVSGDCSGGSGSLRQCIAAAAAVPGPHVVDFSVDGVFILTQGQLLVTTEVTIAGHGPSSTIFDGNQAGRVLLVASTGTLTMSGVTIRGGRSVQTADGAQGDGEGGGILNLGALSLTDTAVTGNTVFGAGIDIAGGSIGQADGGGIFSGGGQLTVADSTISANTARAQVDAPDGQGHALGGGIMIVDSATTLTNVTISGNVAVATGTVADSRGGGMFFGPNNHPGIATNVTVTANTSARSSGVDDFGNYPFQNSIIAANTGSTNCPQPGPTLDGSGPGYNLDDDGTCFARSTDIHANPRLGPLADNGGPTQTHALMPGSPAVDGVGTGCPPPATDQRGVARPFGPACDVGAFEAEIGNPPPSTTTTSTTVAPTTTAATTTTIASTTTTTTAAPATTCFVSGLRPGPPKQQDVTVQNTGGVAAVTNVQVDNGTVSVPPFAPGTTAPIVITATKTDQTQRTVWSFDVRDSAGHSTHCG